MKIAIIEPLGIDEKAVEKLKQDFLPENIELVYYNSAPQDDEEKIKRSEDADIVMLANMPLRKNVLEKCSKLKMISVAFTGVDHIDMDYCKANDIMVCNCSGYANEAVCELVFGMVVDLYRNIFAADEAVRTGKTKVGLSQFELCGKKFGIIGAGAIGLKVANVAKAFGCDVYVYSRTPKDIDGIKFVSLDDLLSNCDVVSVHVPLTKQTKDLINAENITKMKSTSLLINTARGPVVNAKALADALKNNIIAGAGVDVFDNEPPIAMDNPLLNAPNVVLTPHIGFATKEAMEKRAVIAFTNINKYLMGKPQNVM
ncbi:hydroxyacid dehydrogenase [Megamonas funiformis]|uniref:2-hydroxyacid dehydrogenase n=1 Tax=Megamonas funiformis TaxID=437897 RepID=UPI000E3F4AB5|nr:2-hydroxyacid dehydrogenase [Megamonas funiformis]RGJ96718.1 hydroxyacid dehydrogenase [Megamonas funiformis]